MKQSLLSFLPLNDLLRTKLLPSCAQSETLATQEIYKGRPSDASNAHTQNASEKWRLDVESFDSLQGMSLYSWSFSLFSQFFVFFIDFIPTEVYLYEEDDGDDDDDAVSVK